MLNRIASRNGKFLPLGGSLDRESSAPTRAPQDRDAGSRLGITEL